MRTLALVPARAGSKGVPHKNTREFRGLPLLAHAIKVGQATCDQTVVSTEDMETACLAASYGALVVMRPDDLAQDDTPMLPVVQHALANVPDEPDVVVLLQPSSPTVRRAEYVREALGLLDAEADSAVSLVEVPSHYHPLFASEIHQGRVGPYMTGGWNVHSRQEAKPPAYFRDGTVYVFRRARIESGKPYGHNCRPLIIPASDSVTLDTEADWPLGEAKHA